MTKVARLTLQEYSERTPFEDIPAAINSQRVARLPETYAELQDLIARTSNPNCDIQPEIDEFVAMVGASEDPDEITRQLPYSVEDGSKIYLNFVLPHPDAIRGAISG